MPRWLETNALGRALSMSSLYETSPVGDPSLPFFINAVIEFEPLLTPADLLKRLQEMEKSRGRSSGPLQSRPLDIDIVAWGGTIVRSEALSVPHPRYRERAFVLIPLREIFPGFVCPETGRPIEELIASLPHGQRISRVSSRSAIVSGARAGMK